MAHQRFRRTRYLQVLAILAVLSLVLVTDLPGLAQSPSPSAANNQSQKRQEHQNKIKQVHSDASGKLRADLWQKGIEQAKKMKIAAGIPVQTARTDSLPLAPSTSAITGVQWTQNGPAPLVIDAEQIFQGAGPDSGQVTDLAIDPRNSSDQVIYIATNDGGIWKTTNGGTSWQPKTDYMPSLSMGAVALDPSNPSIVYAGTGNNFNNGFFSGVGVYKSLDGGDTWTVQGGAVFGPSSPGASGLAINRIRVISPNIVMVATSNGLYRSINGGGNYSLVAGTNGFVSDLAVDTATPGTIYAAISGQGLFRSTDSGATFPTNLFGVGVTGAPAAGSYAYFSFSQSTKPDNKTIYASLQGSGGGANRGLISTDTGTTWSSAAGITGAAADNGGCQCGYDQTIGVDPQDATRLYFGFQKLYLSTDSGGSFSIVSDNKIHWDNHALYFSPANHWGSGGAPTRLWVGTDGGVHSSTDGGSNWSNLNSGIATNLFRGIDIGRGSSTNNQYTYGGTQDTGIIERRPGFSGLDWHLGIDGDGGLVVVDPSNPQRAYSSDDGIFEYTSNAGDNWSEIGGPGTSGLPDCGGNFAGRSCGQPISIDPNNSKVVYTISGQKLFQSTDSGMTYTLIKTFTSNINQVAGVKIDSNTFWVALSNGSVQQTANVLSGTSATWNSLTVNGAPGGLSVSAIAIDPNNTAQVVVVYAGFTTLNQSSRTKHVFMTTDTGATWTDISGTDGAADPTRNLPDLPLNSVVIDPGTSPHSIIVASDAGVMRSINNGTTWEVLGVGLPTVDSTSLAIDTSVSPSLLRIGTYGRSTFELTAATGPLLAVNANLAFGLVAPGASPSPSRVVQVFNVGSTDLHINGFARVAGSSDFSLSPTPPTPATISPGGELDFTVIFAPSSIGDKTATFQINSDDPFQPAYQLSASGTGAAPKITITGDLNFGTVPRGTSASRAVTVNNTGNAPLLISNAAIVGPANNYFSLVNPLAPPTQTIAPGSSLDFTVRFAPPADAGTVTPLDRTATLQISHNDPSTASPALVPATATIGVPKSGVSSSALAFGQVAVDNRTIPNTSSQVLVISNQSSCGLCDLNVLSVVSSSPDFTVPAIPPIVNIGAGNSYNLTVTFNPSAEGARSGTLTITTDDPINPTLVVSLSGEGLLPGILADPPSLIFGPTVYDPVCSPKCGQTLNVKLSNNKQAELILDNLSISSGGTAFTALPPTNPLTRVLPTFNFLEAVTFRPLSGPARKITGNLHVADSLGPALLNNPPVTADIPLCGEVVGRGIRVLVFDTNGQVVPTVTRLQLQSYGLTNPVNINTKNLPLTTVDPNLTCVPTREHYENQNLQATTIAAQRGSYYILTIAVGSKKATVSFTLDVNEFKTLNVTVQ